MKLQIRTRAALLKLRKNLPGPVRRFARLSQLVVREGRGSPQLPPDLIIECRMCADRFHLIAALPRGGIVAEVGVLRGDFAQHILSCAEPAELHLIDLDLQEVRADVAGDPRVVAHRGLSHEVLARFPDESFDWIYIDADHAFESVKRDAAAAAPKVRKGGFLIFNDFAHMDPWLGSYGVHRAVVEFATEHRWPFAWWAYERMGLYDVALKRP